MEGDGPPLFIMLPLRLLSSLICIPWLLITAAATDKPNIVVFLVDDMGLMDTSVPFLTDKDGNPKTYPLNDVTVFLSSS